MTMPDWDSKLDSMLIELFQLNLSVRDLLMLEPAVPVVNVSGPELDLTLLAEALGKPSQTVNTSGLEAAVTALLSEPRVEYGPAVVEALAGLKKELVDLSVGMRAIAGGGRGGGGGGSVFIQNSVNAPVPVAIISGGGGGSVGATSDVTDRAARLLGHVTVDSAPAITGSVSVSNLPATQAVSGTVTVSNPTALGLTDTQLRAVAVPVSGSFFQTTQPVSLASAPVTPVTGTFFQATQAVSIAATVPVSLATAPTTPVTGTFFQVTQPVSGTVTVANPTTGTPDVSDRAARLLGVVSGTVGVNNFPATQAVSGTVTVANPTTAPETGLAKDATLTGGTVRTKLTDGTNNVGVAAGAAAGSELTVDRLKVNAELKMLDTAQVAGSQIVAAKGDQTTGLWVNVKNTAVPVTGTFFQGTQPVSIAATVPVSLATAPTTPVTGTFFQATQPVSLATNAPTLQAGSTTAVTQATAANLNATVTGTGTTAVPSAGIITVQGNAAGVPQPVSGTFFQGTQPVSGAFFQTTQPVSLAANTPDVTDRAARLLGVLSTGANTVGNVGLVAGAAAIGSVTVTSAPVTAVTIATNTPTLQAGSTTAVTQAAAANLNATVVQATAANLNATVANLAITKGTQGTTGVTTQDLKDSGRAPVTYYTLVPVLSTATDTLQTLTGTKAAGTVLATATPAVVTTGKTFRIQSVWATYISTAVSGYAMVRLRYNTAGVVAVTSPVLANLAVGNATPATANAAGEQTMVLPDGVEVPAGTGVGISVQGFAAATATAVGYVLCGITGYEY